MCGKHGNVCIGALELYPVAAPQDSAYRLTQNIRNAKPFTRGILLKRYPPNQKAVLGLNLYAGGRRLKSSLPDQSFQALKLYFWFSVYSDVDEIVDGACIADFPRDLH